MVTLYVQSAGALPHQDYFWKEVAEINQQRVDEPEVVERFKPLLQTDAFSILIGRYQGQLVLLITGMRARTRKDYRDRTIRNSMLWIFPDAEATENTVRKLAIEALLGNLEADVDRAIREDESGFEVLFQEIHRIIDRLDELQGNGPGSSIHLLGKNTPENRKSLADMLAAEGLPIAEKDSEALVVVTGVKAEEALKKENVWRGLSKLVEKEGWYKYDKSFRSKSGGTQRLGDRPVDRRLEQTKKTSQKTLEPGAIIVGFVLLFLLVALLYYLFNPSRISSTLQSSAIALNTDSGSDDVYYSIVESRSDGTILVASSSSKPQVAQASSEPQSIKAVAISANGKTVVSGSADGSVKVWDVKEQVAERFTVSCHQGSVLSVAISADGKTVVSGGDDGEVKLFLIPSDDIVPQCGGNLLSNNESTKL